MYIGDMQVLTSYDEVKSCHFSDAALTIGSFDGIHLGHRVLLKQLVQKAGSRKKVVITFDPHPEKILSPQPAPQIFPREDQIEIFKQLGIDVVFFVPFDRSVAQLTASNFLEAYIKNLFTPSLIVIGYDFAFGNKRQGDFAFLKSQLSGEGVVVEQIPALIDHGDVVSSTLLRQLLRNGDMVRIEHLLNRPYYLSGVVVHGRKLGRTWNVPTANLEVDREIIPAAGVYFCTFSHPNGDSQQKVYRVVCNIGFAPTVSESKTMKAEFHIIDFDQDLYDQELVFSFKQKIRDEKKFSSIDALKKQILSDIESARHLPL